MFAIDHDLEARSFDYLIVGAGGMGMAFADVIFQETDKSFLLVDKMDRPGGHWNNAYPFVRLHQPSAFYGVNSRELDTGYIDKVGRNKGLMELACAPEILAYYDQVLRQDFLPSGRVSFLPLSDYLGEGRIRSLATGRELVVNAHKVVNAAYLEAKVPAVEPPPFTFDDSVEICAPGALARLAKEYHQPFQNYVVVGAGKTAFDAILYLIDLGVAVNAIHWIMPRQSWLLDRATIQTNPELQLNPISNFAGQMAAVAESSSLDDLFTRIEAIRGLIRIDANESPTMYRCATVTEADLNDLRSVTQVIRKGRLEEVNSVRMLMDEGEHPTPEHALIVNCTADGLQKKPARPIFDDKLITLQNVRPCQQVFSAAAIGHVECMERSEARKNELMAPVLHPDTQFDFLRMLRDVFAAQAKWMEDPDLFAWLMGSRLDMFTNETFASMMAGEGELSAEEILNTVVTAMAKIDEYLKLDQAA
ncbi:MAG: NAD(P)/FAD-dependent oxidoreductase [Pseudomonadota bacterium]